VHETIFPNLIFKFSGFNKKENKPWILSFGEVSPWAVAFGLWLAFKFMKFFEEY
jgi:hypothetical protein